MRTVILKDAYDILIKKIRQIDKDIKQNSKDIARAADFGDLSENAEFDAAKEKQTELFQTLNNLETYMKARIIDEQDINTKVVSFGTTLRLFDLNTNEIETYILAGPVEYELEIFPSIMTFTSPLGQALIGKKKGTVIEIELPKHTSKFLIVDIGAVSKTEPSIPSLAIMGQIESDTNTAGSAYYAGVGAASFSNRSALISRISKQDNDLSKVLKSACCSMKGVKIGTSADISFNDFPADFYGVKNILIGADDPGRQLEWITAIKAQDKIDCELAIDISGQIDIAQKNVLLKAVEECVFVFVDEKEHELLKDIDTEEKVIIVRKTEGTFELWIDDELQLEEKPLEIESVDNSGSGQVLAGVFMALIALGHDEEMCLTVASRLASLSTAQTGVDHLLKK